jgi:hypothetical protein
VTRIELAFSAWEADVLPLNYTRKIVETIAIDLVDRPGRWRQRPMAVDGLLVQILPVGSPEQPPKSRRERRTFVMGDVDAEDRRAVRGG